MPDVNASFQKFISENFIRYRGCLLQKANDGYLWGNGWYSSLDAAKEAIDKTFPLLGNTLSRKQVK